MNKMKWPFWTPQYTDPLTTDSILGSTTSLQIRNSIYITILLIPETRRNQSLMASLSDVEEFAQKITTLKKKPKNILPTEV